MTSDLTSALRDFFADTWPTDQPVPEPGPLAETSWSAFAALGLHLVGIEEDRGGSGGSFSDQMTLAMLAGRHAVDIPVCESAAGALAIAATGANLDASASWSVPTRTSDLTVHDDGTVSGTLLDVPWGATVDQVVAITSDGTTVALRPGDTQVRHGVDLAGQPRDTLLADHLRPVHRGVGMTSAQLYRSVVALRVALTAGALQAVSELTRRYVGERVQFGKPIGSFQAVQAHVVELEQMAVMTTALADRLSLAPTLEELDVTAAQLVTAENALTAARAAHQAHGAIGMTREYRLQAYTRRLHTWSGDFAEPIELARRLGATAASAPSFARLVLDDSPEVAS